MRIPYLLFFAIIGLLALQFHSVAQEELPVSSSSKLDFIVAFSDLELAFESWDENKAPDTVRLVAYRVASGFLAGIQFHYERNRDRLTIHEQIENVPDEMEYNGYRNPVSGVYLFDYTIWVPSSVYTSSRRGHSYEGHGVSNLESPVSARREARSNALEEVARAAMRSEYTDSNRLIPGMLDGRITWYEIMRDDVDPESGDYVFDIRAWVSFEER